MPEVKPRKMQASILRLNRISVQRRCTSAKTGFSVASPVPVMDGSYQPREVSSCRLAECRLTVVIAPAPGSGFAGPGTSLMIRAIQ